LKPAFPRAPGATPAGESIRFSRGDAERWAAFSGDHNPIHFDIDQARLLAADGLVVHGMVALLPMRERIARATSPDPQADGWTRFRALFRLPVPQDVRLSLSARIEGGTTRFGLRPAGATQDHVRAQYGPDAGPTETGIATEASVPRRRVEAFLASYGHGLPWWAALEAAVFAELVQSESDPIWEIVRRTAEGEWGPLTERPLVVHASHTVRHRAGEAPRADGEIRHGVGPIAVAPMGDEAGTSLSCRIPLAVAVAGERVLHMEVGLLVMRPGAAIAGTEARSSGGAEEIGT
jgi:hypothetical protein